MTSKCKKSQIWPFRPWKMTFRAIQPNISFDMWFMSPKRSFMPKKKKSYWSVSEIDPSPPQSWRTDRQTDGQTDRRTTDKSLLEKLRCLSAGGAKNISGTLVCFIYKATPLWAMDFHQRVISSASVVILCLLLYLTSQISPVHIHATTYSQSNYHGSITRVYINNVSLILSKLIKFVSGYIYFKFVWIFTFDHPNHRRFRYILCAAHTV